MNTSNYSGNAGNYNGSNTGKGHGGRVLLTGGLLIGGAVGGCAGLDAKVEQMETRPHYWASKEFSAKDDARAVGMVTQAVTSNYTDETAQRNARRWANFVRVTPTNLRNEYLVELFWDNGDGKLTKDDKNLGERDANGRPKVYLLKEKDIEPFVRKMLEGRQ